MRKGGRLPLPPRIDAITRLDDLEDLAEAFYLANGYVPELVSHWDPKPEFALEIEKWLVRETPPSSLIQYVYSSYLEIDDRIRRRLGEDNNRGVVLTQSGTTSIATVVTYLNNIGIKQLHIVTPAYFAVESLASSFGLQLSFPQIVRRDGRYGLPKKHSIESRNAIWLTFPIYGTSSYIPPLYVASFIDALPADTIVIVDESLAYPDRNSLSETKTIDRVIRIATPQKALCMNGEKVSLITLPKHLSDSFNAWSECLAGGIGASGQNALQFLASDAFDVAATRSRQLVRSTFERMRRVLGSRATISLDQECDGHFVMLYWPALKMSLSNNRSFMKEIMDSSGSLPIPASRNRHPDRSGFAFRVNLFRLDDAGLGGLKRLSDVLDDHV
jgi:histidinol-phosphate/aromatic aminotransferase/cobyric acid decarboxylase-like protein